MSELNRKTQLSEGIDDGLAGWRKYSASLLTGMSMSVIQTADTLAYIWARIWNRVDPSLRSGIEVTGRSRENVEKNEMKASSSFLSESDMLNQSVVQDVICWVMDRLVTEYREKWR